MRVTPAEGVDGAAPHHHTGRAELFSVLGGEVQVPLGDQVVTGGPGDLVVVPHHLPHAFGASPGHTGDFLIVVAPGIDRFDYFRLLERIAYGTETREKVLAEQERFDNWFLESPAWQRARSCARASDGG